MKRNDLAPIIAELHRIRDNVMDEIRGRFEHLQQQAGAMVEENAALRRQIADLVQRVEALERNG